MQSINNQMTMKVLFYDSMILLFEVPGWVMFCSLHCSRRKKYLIAIISRRSEWLYVPNFSSSGVVCQYIKTDSLLYIYAAKLEVSCWYVVCWDPIQSNRPLSLLSCYRLFRISALSLLASPHACSSARFRLPWAWLIFEWIIFMQIEPTCAINLNGNKITKNNKCCPFLLTDPYYYISYVILEQFYRSSFVELLTKFKQQPWNKLKQDNTCTWQPRTKLNNTGSVSGPTFPSQQTSCINGITHGPMNGSSCAESPASSSQDEPRPRRVASGSLNRSKGKLSGALSSSFAHVPSRRCTRERGLPIRQGLWDRVDRVGSNKELAVVKIDSSLASKINGSISISSAEESFGSMTILMLSKMATSLE